MTIHKLSNPQSFVKECRAKGIFYDVLLEAITCIGQQKVCEMFEGKSNRGGSNNVSAGTIQNWLATFEFAYSNPDVKDSDPFQSRTIEKKGDLYDNYVKLVHTRIDEETLKSWDTMSNNKLGDEAVRYGITLGVRNSKSVMNLRERMKDMWTRRKTKFWDKTVDDTVQNVPEEPINYKMNNIFALRKMAKDRGIVFLQKSKDEIIQLLEEHDQKKDITEDQGPMDYEKMNLRQLKDLAKNRGFIQYNNMNNTNLRAMHKQYDEAVLKKKEDDSQKQSKSKDIIEFSIKEFQLKHENGEIHNIVIREDGYINGTMFCKANNKLIGHYLENKNSKAYIECLSSAIGIPITDLMVIKQGGDPKLQGTWVHRKIGYHLAMWVHPPFAVSVSGYLDELLTKGFVKIEKPLLPILDRTEPDLEAEALEAQCNPLLHCNQFVLYIAYIGRGLVKIGSSDCHINERESKHISCESIYPQFRFIRFFPISSGIIEKTIHNLLDKYRFPFEKQREVYKPTDKLGDFVEMVGRMLEENDLQMQVARYKTEILELKNQLLAAQKEILELKNHITELKNNMKYKMVTKPVIRRPSPET